MRCDVSYKNICSIFNYLGNEESLPADYEDVGDDYGSLKDSQNIGMHKLVFKFLRHSTLES